MTKTLEISTQREKRFLEIVGPIQDLIIKIDPEAYPGVIFFFKGGEFLFEWVVKSHYLWGNYSKIWDVFYKEFDMTTSDIRKFVAEQFAKHFQLDAIKSSSVTPYYQEMVEQNFAAK